MVVVKWWSRKGLIGKHMSNFNSQQCESRTTKNNFSEAVFRRCSSKYVFLKISLIFKNTSFDRTPPLAASSFLGFKFDLRFLRISNFHHIYIFWGIIYLIFLSLFHFRLMFSFCIRAYKYRKRISARNRFRYFFFLATNIEKISIYLEDD